MRRSMVSTGVDGAVALVRWTATVARTLALGAGVSVAAIAAVLARDGIGTDDILLTLLLLVAPAVLFVFALGLRELAGLPERLRRLPGRGVEQLSELTAIAGDARRARLTRAPRLLWRLRSVVASSRDLVGFALPLRVFVPPFLLAAAVSAVVCVLLLLGGPVAVLVLLLG